METTLSAPPVAAPPAAQTIQPGDLFLNLQPEIDQADDSEIGVNLYVFKDGERITPAGNCWRATDVYLDCANPYVSIVCEETGAWINPSPEILLDPALFTRVLPIDPICPR